MQATQPLIYHIVPASELQACWRGDRYGPPSLDECGFVHCALEVSVLPVANDYFAGVSEDLLLLHIDPQKLTSDVSYEAAAPIAGGGSSHLAGGLLFPHVYGPIDAAAIRAYGVLQRGPDGYQWPEVLVTVDLSQGFLPALG